MENGKLEEYIETQQKLLKKQLSASRIIMLCNAVLAAVLLILTLAVLRVMPQVRTALDSLNSAASDAEQLMKDIAALSEEAETAMTQINELLPAFNEASEGISGVTDSLTEEGLPKLYTTLENLEVLKKLGDIDIETLNESIQSLHDVVAPLAKLFGK